MKKENFEITKDQLVELLTLYPNLGKNSDVGKLAVEIVKLYFLSQNSKTIFPITKNGIDLSIIINGKTEHYEIKGTADKNIAWHKLKVSSQNCYSLLVNGMTLIRITNIGKNQLILYFLKYKEDFELIPEARWSVIPRKQKI
jgi:hypothetical protein